MRILICDDEEAFLNPLKQHVDQYFLDKHIPCVTEAISDPGLVLKNHRRYDIAFLDIQMGDMNGIALANELRRRNEKTIFFFVTNYDEYQDDAMDLRAFRFFTKPVSPQRLRNGLDKAMEYIDGAYVDIILIGKDHQQRCLVDDILYVTRSNRKTTIVTKKAVLSVRTDFNEFSNLLPQHFFYLVHKSFLVNIHHVQKYTYSEVTLANGARISVAPRRQSQFHRYWFEYLKRR